MTMANEVPSTDPLLTTAEAAAFLSVSQATVIRWADAKKLKASRLPGETRPGRRRFRRSDLERLLEPEGE